MRHRKSGRHLTRTSSHRNAMFRNMTVSLFRHELIKTTGSLPPPGRFLVSRSNTTSLLQTLERTTGIAARRELYPELYGTKTQTDQASNTQDASDMINNEQLKGGEESIIKTEDVQGETDGGEDDGDRDARKPAFSLTPLFSAREGKTLFFFD